MMQMLTALRTGTNRRRNIATAAFVILIGVLVVLPLLMLIFTSLTDLPPRPGQADFSLTFDNYVGLASRSTLIALSNSLMIGLGGTLLALFTGTILAWLASRTDIPLRGGVKLLGILPLFMSSLIGAVAYSIVASPRQGLLNILFRDLGIPLEVNIYSLGGMIFVFGLYYAPYVYMFVYSSLTLANPELEECAAVHGASRHRVFRRITLPLALPALAGAALLTLVLIVENFPVPQILGAASGIYTLPSFIYRLMTTAPPSANEAAAVGILLTVVMAALVLVQRKLIATREFTTISGKGFRPRRIQLRWLRWPAAAFAFAYFVAAVILPLAGLIYASFRRTLYLPRFADLFDPSGWTLSHLTGLLSYMPFQMGLRNSLITGALAAVVGGILFFAMAYLVYRTQVSARGAIEYVAMLPIAIPAVVFGMAMLWTWLILPVPLYGTLWILVVAYVARFMPQGFRGMASTMQQVHREVEEAARVAGSTKLRAVRRVLLPLMRTGIFSTCLLVFILAVRELSSTVFLFTARTRVLAIVMLDAYEGGAAARAALVGLVYAVVLGAVALAGRRWLETRDA